MYLRGKRGLYEGRESGGEEGRVEKLKGKEENNHVKGRSGRNRKKVRASYARKV